LAPSGNFFFTEKDYYLNYLDANIIANASCSLAVASRRAKSDGDFRLPTLLDA
jgi:hypothetical protein